LRWMLPMKTNLW